MATTIPILYRDSQLLVVDKPSGMLSVPDRYDPDAPILLNELRSTLAAEQGGGELLVVHRLDKDTSGVLIFARTPEAHKTLSEAFMTRSVAKTYRAVCKGLPDWEEGSCDFPLKVDGDRRHRTLIDASRGKQAYTAFKVLERYRSWGAFPGACLVEAKPETGRTHQIRVHLSALGHPCLCDPLYGDPNPLLLSKIKKGWRGDPWSERPLIARTALHALAVEFAHPATGEAMRVEAPFPKDLRALVSQLGKL